jgi:hypothetical protein
MAARVMTEHEHSWQFVSHIDGCHFAMTVASCDCGATLRQTAERDLKEDPYAAVWMDDENGDVESCPRCRELRLGAEPSFANEVIPA